MIVLVNDQPKELESGINLWQLIGILGLADAKGHALALNDRVIPRSKLEETSLHEGDRILIIQATQGG
jgi:sulfur carrier protein